MSDDGLPPVWDPPNDDEFEVDEAMYVYGVRRSGKSTTVEKIMLDVRRFFPVVFCFSGTALNNFWQQVLPAHKVIAVDTTPDGSDALNTQLKHLTDINFKRYDAWRRNAAQTGKKEGNPIALIMTDDAIADDTLRRVPVMNVLAANGRHIGAASITMSQAWKGLSPIQRQNIDRYLLFQPDDPSVSEFVRDRWGKDVLAMYERVVSEPYRAFVINNKSTAKVKFMMYKADTEELDRMLKRNVRLGDDKLWEGIDIVEQKKQYPMVSLSAKSTLRNQFNKRPELPDDSELNNMPQPEPEKKEESEAFRSCLLL